MTTPNRTETPAAAASRTAPLDLAALSAKVATVKPPARSKAPGAAPRDNSVVEGWVKELETERGDKPQSPSARALPITLGQLGELRSRLNTAGGKLGAGIGLALKDGRKVSDVVKDLKDGKLKASERVTLLYWTQKRKQSKKTQAAQTGQTSTQENTPQAPAAS